ncbi:hypothetical protein VOWphi5012_035 [Vibrio phage phi50-12]|uniref:Uncharacterized protein n=1 Tax=Vibrio phage phi50-12 TaxID=2654972 RepID=A0A5P8PRC4_9CAUD|nr:MazG-like pyrophosphatase [Vibrio phage phi50-12]QFR59819.1 hypothetical protein VOWphi5012_035 [Vibrio phage phi50-12]
MTNKYIVLNKAVADWHQDRDTVSGSTIVHQFGKLAEEAMSEVCSAIRDGKVSELVDGIGDSMVVLNCMIQQISYNPADVITELPNEKSDEPEEVVIMDYVSSFGDIFHPIARGKGNAAILEAMQVFYTNLYVLALEFDLDPYECYAVAYNEIKDRKGKMIANVFVKESDID